MLINSKLQDNMKGPMGKSFGILDSNVHQLLRVFKKNGTE